MLIKDPPVEIADGVWMLGTNEYPVFLVKEKNEAAIFEGGVGATGPIVRDQLDRLGIAAESVGQIVITHAHPDHVMAVPMFRRIFGDVTVCASKAAADTLLVEKAVDFFANIDGILTDAQLEAKLIEEHHRPEAFSEKQIKVDRVLFEGDHVHVGGRTFEVLETPGHSACSLSFYDAESGVLIISDATGYYIPDMNYIWPNYFEDYGIYLESIKRLSGLGAKVLCLSHNAVIKGSDSVEAYFARAISVTEDYHRRIISGLDEGKDKREIAAQLGEEVHAKTGLLPMDFFQKNCGLLVKQSMRFAGLK